MTDKVSTYQSVEFSRMASGQVERERAGNRVQLEDSTGNPYTANNSLPFTSPDMVALLQQIKAILDDTITVSGTVAITSSTLTSILTTLQGTLTTSGNLQPNVFKPLAALDVSAETTLWTPTTGTKFRLMGGLVSVTGAAGSVVFKDGNSGATIFSIPNAVVGTALPFNLGDGILSGAANNNLRALGAALQILNGTIWGREV